MNKNAAKETTKTDVENALGIKKKESKPRNRKLSEFLAFAEKAVEEAMNEIEEDDEENEEDYEE